MPDVLREHGIDVNEVLAATAMPPTAFSDRDNLISYQDCERLLLECERRLKSDEVSLLICRHTRLSDLGLAGQAAVCAATAGEGLQNFINHFTLHSTVSTASLLRTGTSARLVYAISELGLTDTRHLQIGGAVVAYNILRDLFGTQWQPVAVTFASKSPANPRPLQRYLDAPLQFDSAETAVHFDDHWLQTPLPKVDRQFRRQVAAAVRARRAAMLMDFPGTVRRIVRKQLIFGDFSMDDIATLLSMHRRTLDRHLQKHGVQYGELVDSVKDDVARRLLRDTNIPIQGIAESLHFSSAANFATAFRRRAGVTPSEYRGGAR
jgi:AraC-like DNA-binding protein